MNKRLDFMCVGVQKGATSTLHDILVQHPNLGLPNFKETHFFSDDKKYEKGLQYYFKNNFKKSDATFMGEIDPEYCYFPKTAIRIHKAFPNCKIIFILRNPVDRAYSQYLMTKRIGRETLGFIEAVYSENQRLNNYFSQLHYSYISRGFYTKQITRYYNLFGKENVGVFLFEDIIKNPSKIVKEISQFIGLPDYDYDYEIKSNVASEAKSTIIRDFIFKPNKLKKYVGKILPTKKIKDRIMYKLYNANLKDAKKEPLNIELKSKIYKEFYISEIDKLEALLGRDLSSWKN